jgi:hypothetical protein
LLRPPFHAYRDDRLILELAAMRPIIWLASYPRSGNTYLRALLANYLHANGAPLSINALSQLTEGEHEEAVWRAVTGVPAAERSVEAQWLGRADYFARLRARPGDLPLIVKTHTPDASMAGRAAFEFGQQDRVIHIVRHPGDVAISCADFYEISLDEAIGRLLHPGLTIDGRPQRGFEVFGSWAEHTRMWLDERGVPILRVRYADMVSSAGERVREILSFVGLKVDERRIADAVEFTRFDRMQAQEEQGGFVEFSSSSTSPRFFRKGQANQWREVLTPEQAARLIEPNLDLIEQLGLDARP